MPEHPARVQDSTVAATIGHVSRESLWQKIQSNDALVLVDALSPMSYAASHLPGAINMPPEWVEERALRRIPDRDTEVVVYCASSACDTSVDVAKRLLELPHH